MQPTFETTEAITKVYRGRANIGVITQKGSAEFHVKGTYFEVTLSSFEYAKECFYPITITGKDKPKKQLSLSV